MMRTIKQPLFVILMALFLASAAIAEEKAGQTAPAGPATAFQAKFPITVRGGDYDLLTVILDFPPGTGIPMHFHGGQVLATVVSGELTLTEKGTQRIVKTGESWTENVGDQHSVVNAGMASTRVAVSILLPRGAEANTIVK
jgi:quercetin dioxygenase-like cupin family protein